jgi:hypothetical protein
MRTRMDNPVEVEIQVVEFDIVRVGYGYVDWDGDSVYFSGRFFDDSGYYFRVLFTEPAECGWDTTINLHTFGDRYPILLDYKVTRRCLY